ncbi:MAG: hypothetical protein HDR08_16400 [Lachnospiraceae bacterium]|nr:hypothetical protein [Lachnospiraceae bacterium]MBD5512806.1 hypothetical protein [Lachnospiraceae bacterium]
MKLNFNQKSILDLYPKFYGKRYQCGLAGEEATQEHINVQKMCYLMKRFGISVGNFGYSWDTYGPFSPGLQVALHDLDMRNEDVELFYEETEREQFYADNRIERLISVLHLAEHGQDLERWMELLGSLAFLSYSVLPGEDFDCVRQELTARKSYFNDVDEEFAAWSILKEADMLKLYD